jgi:hypothetical protein
MKSSLPMLMAISRQNKSFYLSIENYYVCEQIKLGRKVKQILKDFDHLTCFGTSTISSSINIDNTIEGRAFWKNVEKKYESRYTNLF